MDELQLVRSAQKGDLDAFNQLIISYQELTYNIAYRMLSDQYSAEDATQKAFISAYRSLRSYRGGSFRAWLLRIVTNKCYDELRHRKRHPTTNLEPTNSTSEEVIESPHWLADNNPTPEQALERVDLERAVQYCINQLPDNFRIVVIMVDLQNFNYKEVSQVTGNPLGTVKSRLARARMRLRDCLQRFRELLPFDIRLEPEGRS